jgi:DNA-binding helix-hairpin-helix protein with protein kinase domain
MGRHPFSGVFRGKGDMPIEKAIAELRYAFGRNAALKLMEPPPNAVTPAILPESLAGRFERAFAEDAWKSAEHAQRHGSGSKLSTPRERK